MRPSTRAEIGYSKKWQSIAHILVNTFQTLDGKAAIECGLLANA